MSRSGYHDDLDNWALIMWRGRVASAIRGKRGQALLRELAAALDAMPEKRLVRSADGEIVTETGAVCALGTVAVARGWDDAKDIDSTEHEELAGRLDVAPCLVMEIEDVNDTRWMTDKERWKHVRAWVERKLKRTPRPAGPAEGERG